MFSFVSPSSVGKFIVRVQNVLCVRKPKRGDKRCMHNLISLQLSAIPEERETYNTNANVKRIVQGSKYIADCQMT